MSDKLREALADLLAKMDADLANPGAPGWSRVRGELLESAARARALLASPPEAPSGFVCPSCEWRPGLELMTGPASPPEETRDPLVLAMARALHEGINRWDSGIRPERKAAINAMVDALHHWSRANEGWAAPASPQGGGEAPARGCGALKDNEGPACDQHVNGMHQSRAWKMEPTDRVVAEWPIEPWRRAPSPVPETAPLDPLAENWVPVLPPTLGAPVFRYCPVVEHPMSPAYCERKPHAHCGQMFECHDPALPCAPAEPAPEAPGDLLREKNDQIHKEGRVRPAVATRTPAPETACPRCLDSGWYRSGISDMRVRCGCGLAGRKEGSEP